MEKKELLYEGKAKKVYTTEDPDVLIVSYKDDATAFNGLKKGTIVGKGAINNRMTNYIFTPATCAPTTAPSPSTPSTAGGASSRATAAPAPWARRRWRTPT